MFFIQSLNYLLTVDAVDNGFPVPDRNTVVVNITIFPFPKPKLEPYYYGEIIENKYVNAPVLLITGTAFVTSISQFILSGPNSASFTIENLGNNSAILRAG